MKDSAFSGIITAENTVRKSIPFRISGFSGREGRTDAKKAPDVTHASGAVWLVGALVYCLSVRLMAMASGVMGSSWCHTPVAR